MTYPLQPINNNLLTIKLKDESFLNYRIVRALSSSEYSTMVGHIFQI